MDKHDFVAEQSVQSCGDPAAVWSDPALPGHECGTRGYEAAADQVPGPCHWGRQLPSLCAGCRPRFGAHLFSQVVGKGGQEGPVVFTMGLYACNEFRERKCVVLKVGLRKHLPVTI